MPDPISYIKSSSGTVNGAVTDALSNEAATAIQRHLSTIAPLPLPFSINDKFVGPTGELEDLTHGHVSELTYVHGYSRIESYASLGVENWAIALYGSAKNFLSEKSVKSGSSTTTELRTVDLDDEVYFARVVTYTGEYKEWNYAYAYGPVSDTRDGGSTSEVVDRMNATRLPAASAFDLPGVVTLSDGSVSTFSDAWHTGKIYIRGAECIEARVRLSGNFCPIALYDKDGRYLKDVSAHPESASGDTTTTTLSTYRLKLNNAKFCNAYYADVSTYGKPSYIRAYNWVRVYGASTAMDDAMARFNRALPPGPVGTNLQGTRSNSGRLEETEDGDTGYYRRTGLVYVRGLDSFTFSSAVNNTACAVAFFDSDGRFIEDLSIIPESSTVVTVAQTVDLTDDKYRDVYFVEVSSYSGVENGFSGRGITSTSPSGGAVGYSRHYGTFSILGDSYSTFKGYLVDSSYSTWYPDSSAAQEAATDVLSVEDTWWWKFANDYGCRMLENDSYSGTTICYDGYGTGTDDGKATSFITRADKLTTPELILVFGGTNDAWVNVGMGEYKYSGWTESDLETFRPALAKLLDDLQHAHVGADIVFILNDDTTVSGRIGESVNTVCAHYGVPVLALSGISKLGGHPNAAGMSAISSQLISFLG